MPVEVVKGAGLGKGRGLGDGSGPLRAERRPGWALPGPQTGVQTKASAGLKGTWGLLCCDSLSRGFGR